MNQTKKNKYRALRILFFILYVYIQPVTAAQIDNRTPFSEIKPGSTLEVTQRISLAENIEAFWLGPETFVGPITQPSGGVDIVDLSDPVLAVKTGAFVSPWCEIYSPSEVFEVGSYKITQVVKGSVGRGNNFPPHPDVKSSFFQEPAHKPFTALVLDGTVTSHVKNSFTLVCDRDGCRYDPNRTWYEVSEGFKGIICIGTWIEKPPTESQLAKHEDAKTVLEGLEASGIRFFDRF